jgi:hypothetical protein
MEYFLIQYNEPEIPDYEAARVMAEFLKNQSDERLRQFHLHALQAIAYPHDYLPDEVETVRENVINIVSSMAAKGICTVDVIWFQPVCTDDEGNDYDGVILEN